MIPRFKVWNNLTKEWFVPVYPDQKGNKNTAECFLSQGGDMYLHQKTEGSVESIIHVPHLIPCLYTGCKDETGKKIYHNDVVLLPFGTLGGEISWAIGYIVIRNGRTWIASGPAGSPTAEDSTDSYDLIKSRVVGNILETPDYFKLLKD